MTIAIALGAMKMMMPNLFRKPVILIPCLVSAVITAIPVALFLFPGTPASAGFGVVGLVGPLAYLDAGLNGFLVVLCWLVIPVFAALITQFLCEKVFKLYDREEVFKFLELVDFTKKFSISGCVSEMSTTSDLRFLPF